MKLLLKSIIMPLITSVISSLITCVFAYKSNAHEESRWRDKLLNLAGTNYVTLVKIQKLRALVHPLEPKSKNFQQCDDIEDLIIIFCNQAVMSKNLTYNHLLPNRSKDHLDAATFRLLCRVLLKKDWNNQTHKFVNLFKKIFDKDENTQMLESVKAHLKK